MNCRKFDLTLIGANDLEVVRKVFKMKVYARISIGSTNSETEKWTPPDKHGEENPAWNYTMNYTIAETMVRHYGTMLVIKLYCRRKLGDRYVGEVHADMRDLYEHAQLYGGSAAMCYPVKKGSVSSKGELRFSCRFGECVSIDNMLLAQGIVDWAKSM
ncbi:protein SRC2 homolog [Impatiens glandulifera]|uniref:protein SRC2 homolog n=1 Tax=Impatiens glandulifera TaxID=253017 RepID=UPI001FB0CA6D|nr:protein SRC2 homolog [Impatiens glandulifera]